MITPEIKIRIHEESDFFSPFDPDQRLLSEDLILYLDRRFEFMYRTCPGKNAIQEYAIHIFSDMPVNEGYLKDAIHEHCWHEMENIRFLSKIESVKELSLGILGSIILTVWFVLSHYTEGVYLEIMTIMGWVAIWEATSSALLRRPELTHQKKLYEIASKAEIIIDISPRGQS